MMENITSLSGFAAPLQAFRPVTARPAAETARPVEAVGELTAEEQQQVQELKARDREVRAHEQAHKSAAGPYAGAISYEFQVGPDGKRYAIGGSVPIDTSPADSPEATIAKMQVVIEAALAPAEPSPQDRAVAQAAQSQLLAAQAELAAARAAERAGDGSDASDIAALTVEEALQNFAAQAYDFFNGVSAQNDNLEKLNIAV
ncbi:MAG: putative metalloprotease CJM1_0395 family protein [Pseudomonadota bacterium]